MAAAMMDDGAGPDAIASSVAEPLAARARSIVLAARAASAT